MRKAACLAAALLAMSACGASSASDVGAGAKAGSPAATASRQPAGPVWTLKWRADFSEPVPLGSFSGCDNYDRTPAAYCSGLPAHLRSQWWAYPYPWPDSATEVHKPVGGYYDPARTVWISDGQMHVRMFRTTTWVHSAAVVPKASIGMFYGRYVERSMVTPDSDPGYGSAHLLWPTSTPLRYEVDFPEGDWDYNYCLHIHTVPEGTKSRDLCPANVNWAQWNTTEIDWWPGNVTFYLNGQLIYHVTGKWVPDEPMSWIIQNQAALKAPWAGQNSAAQINISSLAVYSYAGEQG